jgi:hypothetical protein
MSRTRISSHTCNKIKLLSLLGEKATLPVSDSAREVHLGIKKVHAQGQEGRG